MRKRFAVRESGAQTFLDIKIKEKAYQLRIFPNFATIGAGIL